VAGTANSEQESAEWPAARHDELLRELRRQVSRKTGPDLGEILDWLRRQLDAEIALIEGSDVAGSGRVEAATSGFRREVLNSLEPLLERLAGGRMTTAMTQVGAAQVRLEAFGAEYPRPVLVVTGTAALTREQSVLTSHAGDVITVLLHARRTQEVSRSYQHKARQMRFAVLSALLAGDPDLARRITTGSVPQLLEAERVRVHILYCTPAERDGIAEAFQDPSGYHDAGLMVNCPIFEEHLVCVFPDDAAAGDAHGSLDHRDTLRRLVRDNAQYALGISSPQPLHATAQAYDEALHALAVARNAIGHVGVYRGKAPLEQVLSGPSAHAWARGFLRPMSAAAPRTMTIAHHAVAVPRTHVARALGISRNTVTLHLKRAEKLLGLDLDDVHSRASLGLALALAGPHPVTAAGAPPDRDTPTLEELLRTPPATAWAEAFLHPLRDARYGTLRSTLRAWIDANLDAQRTALHLNISRNTVRAHLRKAEHLLNRDLLSTGAGIHDLVHALEIVKDRDQDRDRDRARQQSGVRETASQGSTDRAS
jgi:DNA-binding CsgD family transcriptional regulator